MDPVAGDQLFGSGPAPSGVNGDSLFSAPKPDPIPVADPSMLNPGMGDKMEAATGAPAQAELSGVNGNQLFEKPPQYLPEIPDSVKRAGSLVAKVTAPLSYPQRFATGMAIRGAAAMGIPGAEQLRQQYLPHGEMLPSVMPSDVSSFYLDKASKAAGLDEQSQMLQTAVRATAGGLGLAANVLTDPLVYTKFMQPTEAASMIQKMGGTLTNPEEVLQGLPAKIDRMGLNTPAAMERNLATLDVPFTGKSVTVKGQPVQDALGKVGQVATTPVQVGRWDLNPVNVASKVARALSPDTGIEGLDVDGRTRDGKIMGERQSVVSRYIGAKQQLNMSSDEDRVATALNEITPNLRPEGLSDELASAAEKRGAVDFKDGNPNFWADRPGLEAQLRANLPDTAKKLGVEIAPGREDAIVQASMLAKQGAAEHTMDRVAAGVITPENIATKVRENYSPHVINPSYKGVKNLAEYQARLKADEEGMRKALTGTPFVSGRDKTGQRVWEGTLEQKNAEALAEKGLDQYFITDPVAAQVSRLLESKQLRVDSEYLDKVAQYGQRLKPSDAREAGMVAIQHPELEGKTIVLKKPDGSVQTVQHRDLYYPAAIASKIQARVAPTAVTGLKATLRDFNQVFRSMIFMSSPGIMLGNSADNMLKTAALTGERFMEASKDAALVLAGKSTGFRTAPTLANPEGVFYSGTALKTLIEQHGVMQGNAWQEGLPSILRAGKELTFQDALRRPSQLGVRYAYERAQALSKVVNQYGEKGENWARAALFLDRVKQGYAPEMAASEVTKYLFNYNRNSPAMEGVRAFMPFMQHPFKTAMVAPRLVANAPGTYNFIQNSFPHVVANAFHDPTTQEALNQILPPNIRQRDGIAGPFLPGNTWVGHIFQSNQPGKMGSMAWADPRIGLRILNHFDYLNKGGSERLAGELNPMLQAALGAAFGQDFTAPDGTPWRKLDYGNKNVNIANRVNFALAKVAGGILPFHNAESIIMNAFGVPNAQSLQPASVMLLNGMAGQFGGVTDLDHDFMSRVVTLTHALNDQKQQLVTTTHQEMKGSANASSLGRYVATTYGVVHATDGLALRQQLEQSKAELAGAQASGQAVGQATQGKLNAGDYAARMKGIAQELDRLNQSFQSLSARYLQIYKGKK